MCSGKKSVFCMFTRIHTCINWCVANFKFYSILVLMQILPVEIKKIHSDMHRVHTRVLVSILCANQIASNLRKCNVYRNDSGKHLLIVLSRVILNICKCLSLCDAWAWVSSTRYTLCILSINCCWWHRRHLCYTCCLFIYFFGYHHLNCVNIN